MKAEKHVQVGAEFEQEQADLDLATKWRSVVVDCHMDAHHFVLAGAERRGIEHANKHMHSTNPGCWFGRARPRKSQKPGMIWRCCALAEPTAGKPMEEQQVCARLPEDHPKLGRERRPIRTRWLFNVSSFSRKWPFDSLARRGSYTTLQGAAVPARISPPHWATQPAV